MTASGNRGWCSDLSDRVRVIRDNDVWRVTERSCFDEFSRERWREGWSLRQRFLTLYWPYFPTASAVRARFSSRRLSISRISFLRNCIVICAGVCFFFLKNRILLSKLILSSEFILLFYSREIWQIFLFTLFVSFSKIDFFLDKFIIPRMINEIRWASF